MLEKIREMLEEKLDINPADVKLESSFKEDLGADSLDLFEVIMQLEEEYDVEFPAEELESIETVNDIIQYLESKNISL